MSFKIPKELESLGFEPIDNVDKLEKGDLIAIPSLDDEPRLRVTLSTLRKWGLAVTSGDNINRYGCDHYQAARSVFGCETWRGWQDSDTESHILVIDEASHDKNAYYGKGSAESSLTFENANSISHSRVIVEKPVYPIMQVKAFPMKPLYPTLRRSDRNCTEKNYPSSFSNHADIAAYRMLVDLVGKESIPTNSRQEFARLRTDGYPDLPFFMAILSCILHDHEEYSKLLSKERIGEIYHYYGYNHRNVGASHLVMTAPLSDDKSLEDHADCYFHHEMSDVSKLTLNMTKSFLENIVKRGALLFKSSGAHKLKSQVLAHEVAADMAKRYDAIIEKLENLVAGLKTELPKLKAIHQKYLEAEEKLSIPAEVIKSVRKIF